MLFVRGTIGGDGLVWDVCALISGVEGGLAEGIAVWIS